MGQRRPPQTKAATRRPPWANEARLTARSRLHCKGRRADAADQGSGLALVSFPRQWRGHTNDGMHPAPSALPSFLILHAVPSAGSSHRRRTGPRCRWAQHTCTWRHGVWARNNAFPSPFSSIAGIGLPQPLPSVTPGGLTHCNLTAAVAKREPPFNSRS